MSADLGVPMQTQEMKRQIETRVKMAKERRVVLEGQVQEVGSWIQLLVSAEMTEDPIRMMKAMCTVYAAQNRERVDAAKKEIEQIDAMLKIAESPILQVRPA